MAGTGKEPSGWDRFDIAAKTLIGIAGIILSIVLGYGEYQDKQRDRALKTQEQAAGAAKEIEAEKNALKDEFRSYYASARSAKPGDTLADSDLDLANTIAQLIKSKYGDGYYLDAALALKAHLTPARGQNGRGGSDVAFQAAETTINSASAPAPSDKWFAVLGSYPASPAGLDQATKAAVRAGTLGCIEIWKTQVSNNYAVVYGALVPRAVALVNAQAARASGIASDAFVQANRGWVRRSGCGAGGGS